MKGEGQKFSNLPCCLLLLAIIYFLEQKSFQREKKNSPTKSLRQTKIFQPCLFFMFFKTSYLIKNPCFLSAKPLLLQLMIWFWKSLTKSIHHFFCDTNYLTFHEKSSLILLLLFCSLAVALYFTPSSPSLPGVAGAEFNKQGRAIVLAASSFLSMSHPGIHSKYSLNHE